MHFNTSEHQHNTGKKGYAAKPGQVRKKTRVHMFVHNVPAHLNALFQKGHGIAKVNPKQAKNYDEKAGNKRADEYAVFRQRVYSLRAAEGHCGGAGIYSYTDHACIQAALGQMRIAQAIGQRSC